METVNSKEPKLPLYATYGTLRKGMGNDRLLDNEHCVLLGTQKTDANYKMVSLGGYPGVIPGEGTQQIVVEVYSVSSKDVERSLDRLESFPRFYQKMEIDTQWGKATMYILSEEKYGHLPIVASGDWKQYVKSKY